MTRRIVALLAMLLMAHLDLARAYAACARVDSHRVGSHQAPAHDHASMTAGPTSTPRDQAPSPIQSECCRAMASCMTSLAFHDGTVSRDSLMERHTIAMRTVGIPASLTFAPDPPPPRA